MSLENSTSRRGAFHETVWDHFVFNVRDYLAFWPSAAQAWGCKGHQTVALLAEKHLTPEARQWVMKLLSENPIDAKLNRYCGGAVRDAMADAATWADDVRGERKNGPWHYIDIPRGSKRSPLEPYCGAEGCVTRAISEQLAILRDPKADAAKRAEALRYIIHFVGDLHQPLHTVTNADEGGNCLPVKYFRRSPHEHNHSFSPNLHSLWDTAILERDTEGADAAEYADTLDALSQRTPRAGRRRGFTSMSGCGKAMILRKAWSMET